jgi:hypothetical protein
MIIAVFGGSFGAQHLRGRAQWVGGQTRTPGRLVHMITVCLQR